MVSTIISSSVDINCF